MSAENGAGVGPGSQPVLQQLPEASEDRVETYSIAAQCFIDVAIYCENVGVCMVRGTHMKLYIMHITMEYTDWDFPGFQVKWLWYYDVDYRAPLIAVYSYMPN